eukprot:SAG11_NODE_3792_length_2222_cov_2.136599_2_plen_106_part_00
MICLEVPHGRPKAGLGVRLDAAHAPHLGRSVPRFPPKITAARLTCALLDPQIEDNLYDLLDVAEDLTEDLLGSIDQVPPSPNNNWLYHPTLVNLRSTDTCVVPNP